MITRGLDRVETMDVGEHKLDLGFTGGFNLSEQTGKLAGYADYSHRLAESISAYARAEAGRIIGPVSYNYAQAGAGVRFHW